MIRKAFVMALNAGSEAEYARRHDPIWPELENVLKVAHGRAHAAQRRRLADRGGIARSIPSRVK